MNTIDEDQIPTTETQAYQFLSRVSERLLDTSPILNYNKQISYRRDYNDRVAYKLACAYGELVYAEFTIASIMADLGFPGCQDV